MQAIIRLLQKLVRTHPVRVIVAIVVVTVLFGAAAGAMTVQDQGFQNFLPDNEISATQDSIAQEFATGSDRTAVQISVYAPEGGDMLSPEGVAVAAQLQEGIRSDPDLAAALVEDTETQSAVITWGDPVLQAAQAQGIDPATLTNDQVDGLYTQALASIPEAQRGLLSATLGGDVTETSATAGVAIVFLQSDAVAETGDTPAQQALVALGGTTDSGFEIAPFDLTALNAEITDAITSQLSTLLLLAVGLIILILVAIYRRPMDVVASMLGLFFTIVWLQGGSALLGPNGLGWTGGQSEMTTAIPILLVGLGVDYGIHLTMRYREERAEDQRPGEAASSAIGAVGVALLLATITTVVGFLTNLSNPLPPLQDFGVFAAVGVVAAFIIMTGFVPSVRTLVDRRRQAKGTLKPERNQSKDPGFLGRAASAVAPTAVKHPYAVIGGALALVVVGAISATNLSTEFSQTEFFPSDSDALAQIERAQDAFQGDVTETTQVLATGGVDTVEAINALAQYTTAITQLDDVRGDVPVDSAITRLAGIQAALAAPGDGGGLPEGVDPATVGAFIAEFEASGFDPTSGVAEGTDVTVLLDGLVALDPSSAGIVSSDGAGGYDAALVSVPTSAGDQVGDLKDGLTELAPILTDGGLTATSASDGLLVDLVLSELQASQLRGLVLTLVASMVILALAFWARDRKPMLGVLAILAVAFVVSWVFGLMAVFGIPFNVLTAMVSALAIGIGVPFGIHVVNRFLEDRKTHDDTLTAMRDTLRNTGGALVGSAVTTMAGFGVLVFSTISPFRQFGVVLAMTIGLALLSSIIVLPAMLTLWARRHPYLGADGQVADGEVHDVARGASPEVEVLTIERD